MNDFVLVTYYSEVRYYRADKSFVPMPFPEVEITINKQQANNLFVLGIGVAILALLTR